MSIYDYLVEAFLHAGLLNIKLSFRGLPVWSKLKENE